MSSSNDYLDLNTSEQNEESAEIEMLSVLRENSLIGMEGFSKEDSVKRISELTKIEESSQVKYFGERAWLISTLGNAEKVGHLHWVINELDCLPCTLVSEDCWRPFWHCGVNLQEVFGAKDQLPEVDFVDVRLYDSETELQQWSRLATAYCVLENVQYFLDCCHSNATEFTKILLSDKRMTLVGISLAKYDNLSIELHFGRNDGWQYSLLTFLFDGFRFVEQLGNESRLLRNEPFSTNARKYIEWSEYLRMQEGTRARSLTEISELESDRIDSRILELEKLEVETGFVFFGEKQWLHRLKKGERLQTYSEWVREQLHEIFPEGISENKITGLVSNKWGGLISADVENCFIRFDELVEPDAIVVNTLVLVFEGKFKDPPSEFFIKAFEAIHNLQYILMLCRKFEDLQIQTIFNESEFVQLGCISIDSDAVEINLANENGPLPTLYFRNNEISR